MKPNGPIRVSQSNVGRIKNQSDQKGKDDPLGRTNRHCLPVRTVRISGRRELSHHLQNLSTAAPLHAMDASVRIVTDLWEAFGAVGLAVKNKMAPPKWGHLQSGPPLRARCPEGWFVLSGPESPTAEI